MGGHNRGALIRCRDRHHARAGWRVAANRGLRSAIPATDEQMLNQRGLTPPRSDAHLGGADGNAAPMNLSAVHLWNGIDGADVFLIGALLIWSYFKITEVGPATHRRVHKCTNAHTHTQKR